VEEEGNEYLAVPSYSTNNFSFLSSEVRFSLFSSIFLLGVFPLLEDRDKFIYSKKKWINVKTKEKNHHKFHCTYNVNPLLVLQEE
jgi:hypothetical protein